MICYEKGEYGEFINCVGELSKNKVKTDIDLQIKIAESYFKMGKHDNTCLIYRELLKLNGKSSFLSNAINERGAKMN